MSPFRIFHVTGKRFADGTYSKGTFTDGPATAIDFYASVQQPTPDDLELLEEGKRSMRSIVLFTDFPLRLVSKTANADRVFWDGDWYEVDKVKPFKTMFQGSTKAICLKIENVQDIPTP